MEEKVTRQWQILKYDGSNLVQTDDVIATEYALTVVLNGQEFATMVCTPSDLKDLVIGFLAAEGIIRTTNEIKKLAIDDGKGFAYVDLKRDLKIDQKDYNKRVIGSCCGKSRQFYFQSDVKTAKTIMTRTKITPSQCLSLMTQLRNGSQDFKETGGVHNAALCTTESLLTSRTDIGRHNTLDKLFGYSLLQQLSLQDKVIAFSGRISSEVILKVAKIGIGILLSKSAPTDLALKLADDLGITAIGFIRGETMNVYTHPERIDGCIPL